MNSVYLLLGANLGNPKDQLETATEMISLQLGDIQDRSALYRSSAWGVQNQPDFYNQVLSVQTKYTASEVLSICQGIEKDLGRTRGQKWGARIIDIDILYFNNKIIDRTDLHIPHPYLHQRRFTLLPLCEIAPNYIHPKMGQTNKQLLANCTDPLSVIKI